jgi:predicted kinase
MTFDEALRFVRETEPNILYIGGKTSTGKSTFAAQLKEDLRYKVVELDKVVQGSVILPLKISNHGEAFNEVYKRRDKLDWIQRFIEAADNEAAEVIKTSSRVIIDGAVANPVTLRELLASLPGVVILYFHPTDLDVYERNLTNRFKMATPTHTAGLPTQFWDLVDKAEFQRFCETGVISVPLRESISKYAHKSQESSEQRIDEQSAIAPNMRIVNI